MKHASRLFPALAALLLTGACATTDALAGDASDDLSWGVSLEEKQPRLLFGVPDSDVVFLGLYCRPGTGHVELTDFDEKGAGRSLALVSGKDRATVPLKADRLGRLPVNHPVLAAFRRTGRLGGPGDRRALDGYSAGTETERAELNRFFRDCRAA